MTPEEIIEKYLEDAFALHPGHMTASGLLTRLADAGYRVGCPVCERGKTDCPDHPFA
jgi:hypothetical protein